MPTGAKAVDASLFVVTYYWRGNQLDPVKHDQTLEERGLDFADAGMVFDGPVFTFEDARFAYPEPRFATYGLLHDRLVAVIWTKTDRGRRVISMRKANDREQARYRQRLG